MARLTRTLMLFALIFVARPVFAGGACPSGANYTNPSNPTGPRVTLASLGITSCYYVAANGSDSNDGLSEASGHPWAHVPFMPGCANSCATLQNSINGGYCAGCGWIFRGGDTWNLGVLGGSWNLNQYPGIYTYGGKSGSPLYIGVDIGWYSGASWARPVLTAGNPLCNPSLVNGTTCSTSTMSIGIVQYYVPSCAYQLGSNNQMISMGNEGYIWIDNFEMTGLCQSLPGQSGGGADGQNVYVRYSGMSGPVVFENLYIHGASHLQFAGWLTSAACNVNPSVCLNITAFVGSVTGNGGNPGDTVIFNVVDFADSDTGGGQLLCGGGLYNAAYNVFRYTSSCVPKPLHVFHDNLYEYFFENGHSNLIESFDVGPISAFYNNVIRHVDTSGATGSVLLWLGPQTGGTDYIFNNLIYDVGGVEYLNTGGTGLTTNKGNYTYFNNTFQSNVNQPILRMSAPPIGTVLDTNNHYIDDASQYNLDSPGSWTATTPLLVTQANAKKAGYTSGSSYAYQPASANCNGNPGSCTVGNGINKESYCTALSAAASSDPFLSDAASACATDTHYACNYDTSTHSVSCPARPVVARPTSAAWNIGAYESNGTQANAPNSPSNLTAVVQ